MYADEKNFGRNLVHLDDAVHAVSFRLCRGG